MKILVVYYSMYGHIHHLAEAIAEGARKVKGALVEMRRVPETLPLSVLETMERASPTSFISCSDWHG